MNVTIAPVRPFRRAIVLAAAVVAGVAALGGCARPSGTLIILQNQAPVLDSTTNACKVATDDDARLMGTYDVDLDRAYPYFVYPLVENRLPSVITTGGVEAALDVDRQPQALQQRARAIAQGGRRDPQ